MIEKRYHRQIILQDIGKEGQKRLFDSHVLVVGVGGLGSAVSIYLAVSGIGNITIVDKDVIDISNLNRQILHFEKDIGRLKVDSARDKLLSINSNLSLTTYAQELSMDLLDTILPEVDIIIDALDNFESRLLLNKAIVKHNKPLVYGGVYGLTGMCSFILPKRGPCLSCFIPLKSHRGPIPVLGSIAGLIGTIQATEAIKYIVGFGENLIGRLLIIDGSDMKFRDIPLKKNPLCKVCSKNHE